MKSVVYASPWIPADWIAAHGFQPRRITPQANGHGEPLAPGRCIYSEIFSRQAQITEVDCVIFASSCDQMRRSGDAHAQRLPARAFLFNMPAATGNAHSRRLYIDELRRLGRHLERLGGISPTPGRLASVIAEYEEARIRLRGAREDLHGRELAESIHHFNAEGATPPPNEKYITHSGEIALALVGGPLMREQLALFDIVTESGGRIALDASETGERGLPTPIDRRLLGEDPFAAMAEAYFEGIPDVRERPNWRLYNWLKTRFDERFIRGVILHRQVWCDLWQAEAPRLKEWCGLPTLELEGQPDGRIDARTRTRIEAFIEALE